MVKDNDFVLWADGRWSFGSDLKELEEMPDNYTVLKYKSKEWNDLYTKEVMESYE